MFKQRTEGKKKKKRINQKTKVKIRRKTTLKTLMSQNIHCSKRPKVAQYLLLILLLTDHLTTIKSQSANKNDAETLTIHQNSPYHSNLDHRSNDHLNENANENNNDLDLYDEPLFFEESEFNEHHQSSPYKHVLNNLESLLKSLSSVTLDNGLTLIPTEARPELNENQNPKVIYIPAIISIHKLKLSENKSVICSTEINSPAIYDLEAILWTLDQINQLIAFKNDLMFNLAVLDSCSSPIILERRLKSILNDRTSSFNKSTSFHINNLIGFVTSISSSEFAVAHNLLSPFNITLISAQDISFLPSKLGFQNHALQTALPIQYFSYAALQHLKEQNKSNFSIIYSNDSLQSTTMLDSLVNWITSKDNQLPKDIYLNDKKKAKQKYSTAAFCMQTILSVPSNLNTGDASKLLIQLQNDIKNNNKNNNNDENIVLILTESHTTRELLIAYQHLTNAGILNRLSFVLIKESNLNIVTGVESIMLNTLVIRESQKSLRDYVEYFEQLKADNNLRNPFFKQYWLQSTNCGLNRDSVSNRDCLFDQIDPINTINAIQSTFALVDSLISIKKENCDEKSTSFLSLRLQYKKPAFCNLFNDSMNSHKKKDEVSSSSIAVNANVTTKKRAEEEEKETEIEKSMDNLKADLLDQLMSAELDLHQLSKHFNHAIKFTKHAFPNKMVDVLKFSIVNQAYRFDRIANYLNSGLIKDLKSTSVNSLAVNHQLLICNLNSPYSSSLTRSSSFNNSSRVNNTWSPQYWWRCWYSIATITSLIGALISIVCTIYFLFTFDYKVGSTILGYMILLGIFLLYIVNFLFLFPYSFVICWARNYLMSISYTIILSSMLVKVMNSWRLHTYHNYNNLYIQHLNLVNGNGNLNNMQNFNNFNNLNQNTNLFLSKKLNSISTLVSMCLGLVALESK